MSDLIATEMSKLCPSSVLIAVMNEQTKRYEYEQRMGFQVGDRVSIARFEDEDDTPLWVVFFLGVGTYKCPNLRTAIAKGIYLRDLVNTGQLHGKIKKEDDIFIAHFDEDSQNLICLGDTIDDGPFDDDTRF